MLGWAFVSVGLVFAGCGDDGSATSDTESSQTTGDGGDTADTDESADETAGTTGVTYSGDIRPLFSARGCTICHHENSAIDIDIADPFSPPNGLVGSTNTWAIAHPEGNTPMLNVDPGNPDESFLMDKIGDPAALDMATAGNHMPLLIEALTDDEIASLRAWIDAGANDDQMFQDEIRPIFGDETSLGAASGKCTWCHHSFPGGQAPNLTDPFDPMTGAVGVPSIFDPERMRIAPGDADNSILVLKVELTEPGALGQPMPLQFPVLTEEEIATVRTWIEEGAQDN